MAKKSKEREKGNQRKSTKTPSEKDLGVLVNCMIKIFAFGVLNQLILKVKINIEENLLTRNDGWYSLKLRVEFLELFLWLFSSKLLTIEMAILSGSI